MGTVLGWESPEQEICGPANIVKYNKGDRDINKEMDFSQYFWPVPSRHDHLAGTLQRQESLLETFIANSLHALTVTFFLPGPLTILEEPDTFFWGNDIISRTTRWLLLNTGTTFNLLLPLFLVIFGLLLVVAFFSALGVGGLSSLGLLDRTEEAGTSMIQSATSNTETILERAGQATRSLVRQALSYLGLATEVQTQDDQLLVDHSLVDDGVEEDEEDEKEDEEEDGVDEKLEEEEDNLDFLQNFPNFYTMAADMMNQLNGDIPEVLLTRNSSVIAANFTAEVDNQPNSTTSKPELPVEAYDPATLLRRLDLGIAGYI